MLVKEATWIGLSRYYPVVLTNIYIFIYIYIYIHSLHNELGNRCVHGGILYKHIAEAETKWPPFRGRHFQIHFLEWKGSIFYSNFIGVCSHCSRIKNKSAFFSSDNGLAPIRRQAIMWTNAGFVYGRVYVLLNELTAKRNRLQRTSHS